MSSVQFNKWLSFYCQKNGIKTQASSDQHIANQFLAAAKAAQAMKSQMANKDKDLNGE